MVCERPVLAVLLLLGACKTSPAAGTNERVAQVEARLSEDLGTEVNVQCAAMVDRQHQYCTAVVPAEDDLAFPVRVKFRGDELDYTTKRWVPGARMVKLGKHALSEKLDIAVDSLTCPRISHMPDGTKVRCEASAEGVSIPIEVAMVVKVRKLTFEPVGGVIFGQDAARDGHQKLHDEGVHVEVTCSEKAIVSVPGKRFQCQATLPDKTTRAIHYLITGTGGQYELGTAPPKEKTQ